MAKAPAGGMQRGSQGGFIPPLKALEHPTDGSVSLSSLLSMKGAVSDVNKATTLKAKAKVTTSKAKNTTTFPQHLYRTINVLRSNLQS